MLLTNSSLSKPFKKVGFTFVELLIAISIMAIAFFPIMELFTTSIEQIQMTSEDTTALGLAREGMEMVRNLNLSVDFFRTKKPYFHPPVEESPIFLNNKKWRVLTKFYPDTAPLQVEIIVYEEPGRIKKLSLTTLLEDLY